MLPPDEDRSHYREPGCEDDVDDSHRLECAAVAFQLLLGGDDFEFGFVFGYSQRVHLTCNIDLSLNRGAVEPFVAFGVEPLHFESVSQIFDLFADPYLGAGADMGQRLGGRDWFSLMFLAHGL